MSLWRSVCLAFISLVLGIILSLSISVAFGQTKPGEVKRPIKIGYLAPLSAGAYAAPSSDMRDGFLLYLSEKGNQLAGRPIEVLTEDTEAKPDVGLTKAKKLVERDKVNLLTGIYHSGVAYAIAEYIKGQKIPVLIQNAGADDLTQRRYNPYLFRVSWANSQFTHPLGEWAYRKGHRKAAIMSSDYSAGWEYSGGFARTFTGMGGQIIQEVYFALGTPDPGPFITAIKPEVDMVFAFHAGADALRFVRRFDEYGLKKRAALIGWCGLTDDNILPEEGDSALGIVTSANYTSVLDNRANKAFIEAVRRKHNRPATYHTLDGYVGAMMLERALRSVQGNIEDRESFIKALGKVEIPETPRGPVRFDPYNNIINNCYICEVKKSDGKMVNALVDTYSNISQFWKWTPEEYMKMPTYISMKGKWAK